MQRAVRNAQNFLAWFALAMALLTAIVVITSYVVSATQSYRGPTLAYFYLLFFTALISRSASIALLIFILPLLPNFATQLEYVVPPKVKYFVAYPGLDAIVGLFLGQCARSLLIDHNLRSWLKLPPWPFGFALLVITLSCVITIDRNLWQAATDFSWFGLVNNIFRFKHVLYGNNFAPLNDLWVYSGATLLIICLLQVFKNEDHRDQLVFKPLILGVIVSASWGLLQSMTGFGLPESALTHRSTTLGFSAYGFQPDIHAFAAHMLVGAVGLFGYIFLRQDSSHYLARSCSLKILILACTLSWAALILSKSRASLIFALMLLLFWAGVYLKAKKVRLLTPRVLCVFGLAAIALILASTSERFWLADTLREFTSAEDINFEILNKISTYRLEIFAATLRMFSQFPMMGIGQSNFFHLSPVLEFAGSPWMAQAGGENAHNYFLQTLAELGLVGATSFTLVFLWPYKHCKETKKLVPAFAAICAIFLGNIYSHSLIIRENLYLLAVFVALLYAHCETQDNKFSISSANGLEKFGQAKHIGTSILVVLTLAAYVAYIEVINAKGKFPFIYGSDCRKLTTAFADGWTSGRLVIPLDAGRVGVKLQVDQVPPATSHLPLDISLSILDKSGRSVHTVNYLDQVAGNFSMQITIPESKKKEFQGGSVVMQLSKCFSPSNFGLKDDSRKLGVHLESIEQL